MANLLLLDKDYRPGEDSRGRSWDQMLPSGEFEVIKFAGGSTTLFLVNSKNQPIKFKSEDGGHLLLVHRSTIEDVTAQACVKKLGIPTLVISANSNQQPLPKLQSENVYYRQASVGTFDPEFARLFGAFWSRYQQTKLIDRAAWASLEPNSTPQCLLHVYMGLLTLGGPKGDRFAELWREMDERWKLEKWAEAWREYASMRGGDESKWREAGMPVFDEEGLAQGTLNLGDLERERALEAISAVL